jgi:hypothetical protein
VRGKGIGKGAHLALAQKVLDDKDGVPKLARELAESRAAFAAAFKVSESFYPPCTRRIEPGRGIDLDSGHDLAARLAGTWLVDKHPDLDFVYIDREIPVARRSDHPRLKSTAGLTTDLILANARDRTPIVAEVKRTRLLDLNQADRNPIYALYQALGAATLLATPSQLDRLRKFQRYEFDLTTEHDLLDIYLIGLNRPTGTYMDELLDLSSTIAERLLAQPETAAFLRQIVYLFAEEEKSHRSLRLSVAWRHPAVSPIIPRRSRR